MKKFIASAFVATTVFASLAASAGTIGPVNVGGFASQTNYAHLGSGSHTLSGTGIAGSGTARAMKIIPNRPDEAVATTSVTSPRTTTTNFHAVDKNADGVNQSYYIRWTSANPASKASVSIY
ncbi:hypothetical protein [Sporosarcina sp. HYO08]|uniref:hypothetical protein n=1 Tax=Sporosarcina sp. HYO08 TaxID=1759557 RepID=UPI00079BBC37|nr:hypothetical protein [Sporosarcina sp. HYO08]KXH78361.1 hypothetical protein AU377_13285 [Sporosarcina sp. HYO08]